MTVAAGLQAARALLQELATACPGSPAAARLPEVLGGLAEAEVAARTWRDTELRLDSIADTLFGLASLDFSRRTEIRGDGGVLDGVVGCINMLGEELAAYLEERGRVERELEQRVAQRTRELQAEMHQRQRIETELRMANKLEAVGRLASGVAHEINTPVQFVSDSVQFVKAAMTELVGVVGKLTAVNHAVLSGVPAQAAAAEAQAATDDADVGYLLEHGPQALDRALEGLAQVASIVRSLKAFAHPDAREMESVDLNRGIASTLVMARNEYKYVAEVVTELGELLQVTCHPGEINQAVLNILVNAAHAIGDVVGASGAKGRITVTTHRDGECAVIAIADTGTGIPDHIRSQIFDPFFTTKEVGRGTGQGLAMVHSIVERHAGTVRVDSVVGRGSTFEIRLPITRDR
ncbi:MAG TPA: ATP-binding protein [Kofleriaceae bacterium]|nr:ATP-binding protein [Kofleriaceae bacterium]